MFTEVEIRGTKLFVQHQEKESMLDMLLSEESSVEEEMSGIDEKV